MDFIFQLTSAESETIRSQNVTASIRSKVSPYTGNYDFKNLKAASSIDYYEEFTVREFALLHIKDLDDFDWSYDPSGNFQGTNWNKK